MQVEVEIDDRRSPSVGTRLTALVDDAKPWAGSTPCWTVSDGAAPTLHVPLRGDPGPEGLRRSLDEAVGALPITDGSRPGPLVLACDVPSFFQPALSPDRTVEVITSAMVESLARHDGVVRVVLEGVARKPAFETAAARGRAEAEAVLLAQRLTDARGNEMSPLDFASFADEVAGMAGLGIDVLGESELRGLGFGAHLAVGAGSQRPPCLVELRYCPRGSDGMTPLVLVGKGITFDSGGLSLKGPREMVGMHTDKAGAAAIVGAMSALRTLDVSVPVSAYLAMAENLPGPGCVRPGDIVTGHSGTRIEVVDTDFEGRLVLSDALSWAAHTRPRAIVDVATLTHQATIALGPEIGALFANDDPLAEQILHCAEQVGEALWRMPLAQRYAGLVRSGSDRADLRNHPGNDVGRAITAALFLAEFVPPGVPWAHLDIAGPAVVAGPDHRATGFGVRTLLALAESFSAA